MKLRITNNSLRMRLTRGEVEEFSSSDHYENSVDLAGDRLTYRLVKTDRPSLTATLADNTITVGIPAAAADRWTGSDDVAVDAPVMGSVKILIEKDFACLKPRPGEDTGEHYPHPETEVIC